MKFKPSPKRGTPKGEPKTQPKETEKICMGAQSPKGTEGQPKQKKWETQGTSGPLWPSPGMGRTLSQSVWPGPPASCGRKMAGSVYVHCWDKPRVQSATHYRQQRNNSRDIIRRCLRTPALASLWNVTQKHRHTSQQKKEPKGKSKNNESGKNTKTKK